MTESLSRRVQICDMNCAGRQAIGMTSLRSEGLTRACACVCTCAVEAPGTCLCRGGVGMGVWPVAWRVQIARSYNIDVCAPATERWWQQTEAATVAMVWLL